MGGIALLSDRIQSGNFVENSQGFAWRADGSGQIGGVLFQPTSIRSANFVTNETGFMFSANGTFELNAPGGWIRSQMLQNDIVTTAKLDDLAVTTLKIATNAVTVPVSKQWAGNINIPNGSTVEVIRTDAVNFEGQPVLITCYVTITAANPSTGINLVLRRLGGPVVSETVWSGPDSGVVYTATGVALDTPPAGLVQYVAEVSWAFNAGARAATKAVVIALGVKR